MAIKNCITRYFIEEKTVKSPIMRRCSSCHEEKNTDSFSSSQIKKGATRKCSDCIAGGLNLSGVCNSPPIFANPSVDNKIQTIQIPLITIPTAIFSQLQSENQTLKQENAVLKQEAIGLNARIDYLKKWESSQATIEDLQRENENLRRENQELRDEITNLKSQISVLSAHQAILMKSFKRENRLALRKMVDDAKKMGLNCFSVDIQNYIKRKSVKNELNSAAYVFDPSRVKEAIECEEEATKKALLLRMWNILYKDDEESDNSDCEFDDV